MDEQAPQTPSPQSTQPQNHPPLDSFPKKRTMHWGIIIGIILVILAAGVVFASWNYQKNRPTSPNLLDTTSTTTQPNGNQLDPGSSNYPTTTPVDNQPASEVYDPYNTSQCSDHGPLLASRSGLIQWMNPKKADLNIFWEKPTNSNPPNETYYLVGHFIGGKYEGGDLFIGLIDPYTMGGPAWVRVVYKNNRYTILDKYSDELYLNDSNSKNVDHDQTFVLSDLEFPKNLSTWDPPANFENSSSLGFNRSGHSFFCGDNLIKIFKDAVAGQVYTDNLAGNPGNNYPLYGFYIKSPDGTRIFYDLDVTIVGKDNIPQVVWGDGKKNNQEYSYQARGGCGSSRYLDVVDVKQEDLVQLGTSITGDPVFGYKNINTQELKDMFENLYLTNGQQKPSYSQFLAEHPIFFWKDPFGSFVRFKSVKYQPVAECGKPVIYLYPEKTQKVSVKLSPVGGFSYTEPAYNSGWNVIADSLSNITNVADGKTYPYLFWEGRGGLYQTPSRGFVTGRNNVHQLLEEKLSLAGLNEKERKDFEEFWEPKMQSAPYYFVTFMGNSVMDEIAPLSISPKPDTVIRILMDFTPLDHPVTVQGFNIRTPERKGFTVVEWGGVLRNDKNEQK